MVQRYSLFDIWLLYEAWVYVHQEKKQAQSTISRTQTALLRYTLPGWGFVLSKGERLTKWEIEKGLDQMRKINLEIVPSALEAQRRCFDENQTPSTIQRTYRAALIKLIEWCEQQSWWSDIQHDKTGDDPALSEVSESALLDEQEDRIAPTFTSQIQTARELYIAFFLRLVNSFHISLNDYVFLDTLFEEVAPFIGTQSLKFLAINGSSSKTLSKNIISSSINIQLIQGELELEAGDNLLANSQESPLNTEDVSVSSRVSMLLSEFIDAKSSEVFSISDRERVQLLDIDLRLLELFKIHHAIKAITESEIRYPKVVFVDFSPSSLLARVVSNLSAIPILRNLNLPINNAVAALAHPFNSLLNIPSISKAHQYKAIIAELYHQRSNAINLDRFASQHNITLADLTPAIELLTKIHSPQLGVNLPFAHKEVRQGVTWLITDVDCVSSWNCCVDIFKESCQRLFEDDNQRSASYRFLDEENTFQQKGFSPDDIRFLTSIGIRVLIEICWEKKILLIGLVKDSMSRAFTHNYLNIMKELGSEWYSKLSNIDLNQFFDTDRFFLEQVPLIDETMQCPWASIEFDSIYAVFSSKTNPYKEVSIDRSLNEPNFQERMFARSFAQFYLNDSQVQLMPVLSVERLVHPDLDQSSLVRTAIDTESLGRIQPLCYWTISDYNMGQEILMYLISRLTYSPSPSTSDFFKKIAL